ncbi:gas vesicle protein GvpN [Sphaerospermopsis aphanizomenoides BCCUSP55]|uniref:gas vesicle protein GvpN n=1 Tax=Sphaerospermopsis aphanizomenoides TaxID=459663 RepID=UPI001904DA2D|nr:gas vesicle protein GvpN [Sphaerospermopsis aphanizomenoides]MBK1989408.1 gas vesicle protein GvpN [Sphaerospermopsis aphanizomenoides BCCUSP55]
MTIINMNQKRAVLRVRPGQFVVTPAIEKVAFRALRYLHSGFPIHLRGPAGTGKTTLALHLAHCISRPVMLLFGDDEFKSSDLIGSESGYTHKKLLDNYIHSVVKVEDEFRQNWVDSRLTLACREGFTLVYDEFNRSRPEVNNVLLSALEEKILSLPPSSNQPEYLNVHPQFRAIFTSNPEEYCGVHSTQDALMDRLVTINMPEPDELTQTEIVNQKTNIDRESAHFIVHLVKSFRLATGAEKTSGLRSCLMIGKVCADNDIFVTPENEEFRDIAMDILFNRTHLSISECTTILHDLLNQVASESAQTLSNVINMDDGLSRNDFQAINLPTEVEQSSPDVDNVVPFEKEVYNYLLHQKNEGITGLQKALQLERNVILNALHSLEQKSLVNKVNRLYTIQELNH